MKVSWKSKFGDTIFQHIAAGRIPYGSGAYVDSRCDITSEAQLYIGGPYKAYITEWEDVAGCQGIDLILEFTDGNSPATTMWKLRWL